MGTESTNTVEFNEFTEISVDLLFSTTILINYFVLVSDFLSFDSPPYCYDDDNDTDK